MVNSAQKGEHGALGRQVLRSVFHQNLTDITVEASSMMDWSAMSGGMIWAMGIGCLLVLIFLVVVIAAGIKYLRS
jgi:hypothetical protein